jgi:hypothetical protein
LDDAYRQLALHLEIPGLVTLLEAQEGRTVHQAGIAIQSKLTEHIRITDYQRWRRRAIEYHRSHEHREHMVIQLSNPREYTGEGVADRGSLDEKGRAYWSRIDNDHKEDEEENASEAGSDEGIPDASTAAKQDDWPQRPSSPGHGDNCDDGAGAPDESQGPLAEAGGIGHHQMATRKEAESAEAEEGSPTVGGTAPEMMHTVNMILRNLRDQELIEIDTHNEGPGHRECFLQRWSSVEYSHPVAARQDTFDGIFEGADRLITNATPSETAGSERDEQAAWEQTQVLMQGVADLADELDEAGFQYQARNRSRAWKLDIGWYPTSMHDAMEDPEHAVNK